MQTKIYLAKASSFFFFFALFSFMNLLNKLSLAYILQARLFQPFIIFYLLNILICRRRIRWFLYIVGKCTLEIIISDNFLLFRFIHIWILEVPSKFKLWPLRELLSPKRFWKLFIHHGRSISKQKINELINFNE